MSAQGNLFPSACTFGQVDIEEANAALLAWGHKMGPINRPAGLQAAYGLTLRGRLISVAITADLVAPRVAGFSRAEAIELARVCACEPWANRVAVRLWREVAFPEIQAARPSTLVALSYQDANLHIGDLYRFDGWARIAYSRSGPDRRSGRQGREKWIWAWPRDQALQRLAAQLEVDG